MPRPMKVYTARAGSTYAVTNEMLEIDSWIRQVDVYVVAPTKKAAREHLRAARCSEGHIPLDVTTSTDAMALVGGGYLSEEGTVLVKSMNGGGPVVRVVPDGNVVVARFRYDPVVREVVLVDEMAASEAAAAADRVETFLERRATMRGIDLEEITTVAVGGEFYPLTAADLRALIAATRRSK